ncbi:3-oxoadipate enol-lactonase [Streptomyces sp. NBC_00259]|uniref:3-oxoadipate enol-lactonase n=1 Tax=Streptomyces sp. NBC_00259 TaxID=2903643 RepID=UPI002E27F4BE|nr:3-oxoadipate enol-lactonase [Streptomyces sp. NBC_00259]
MDRALSRGAIHADPKTGRPTGTDGGEGPEGSEGLDGQEGRARTHPPQTHPAGRTRTTTTGADHLLHHRAEGPKDAPVLILGPSLGTSLRVWEPQASALARDHRVIRWDLPGHGGSRPGLLPAEGATVADLGRHVLRLADAAGAETFAYAGVSLGGAVGTWLAAHRPARVTGLALVCSSARFGAPGPWLERARLVRTQGMAPLAESAPARWFTPAFTEHHALVADLRSADPAAYAACCEILAGLDLRPELPRISAPTLVVAGRDDRATPPAHARELADGIRDAQLLELPRAGHLAGVEQPQSVLTAMQAHFG